MYSGRQPAITPLTATFQTVAAPLVGQEHAEHVVGLAVA